MRITNPTILRGYNRDLNRLLNLKTQTEKRITSGRKFARASEAPLSAAKALNVRKSLYYSEQYKENLKVADKFYTEAETSLLQVSEKMATIRETIIAAVNTTKDMQDYNIYAQQLETHARELCAIFNTDSAGRAIFGGESDDTSPFDIINDANGNASTVLYHGVPVNAMSDYKQFPYSKEVNLDIGLGMDINQETQEVDPQSVLKISFHGTEITGCGAQYGVADVDLSQIKQNRSYCIDVYAGNVKKTITFTGRADQASNIAEINAKLDEAFKKQKEIGEGYPKMDEQGVIALFKDEQDAKGNVTKAGVPVDDGICCVVNNKEKNPRAETLVVDNDSGYTNKYKVNVSGLEEGQIYTLKVTVGDGGSKTITFTAATDDDPEARDQATLDNIQAALDEAFGEGKVNISKGKATMGIITSEGNKVKVHAQSDEVSSTALKATITTPTGEFRYDLSRFEDGKEYWFGSNPYYKVKGGDSFVDNFNHRMQESNGDWVMNENGSVTKRDGSFPEKMQCFIDDGTGNSMSGGYIDPIIDTNYTIDLGNMTEGGTYQLKVINGTSVKNISFKAGADEAATLANLKEALNGTGATLTNAGDGVYKFSDGVAVANLVTSNKDNPVVEKESIYSNNYIQLTLDAARALRQGDIAYANGCIDRIVTANENLLVEIANLGCNEDFISFNLDRLTTREENLQERQVDLEATDAKSEITLWKTYEAMYNACLQMSSSVVPNSIFNYIK